MPERQAPITTDENRAECQEERQEGDKGDVQAGDQGEQVTQTALSPFSISYLRKGEFHSQAGSTRLTLRLSIAD